MAKVLLTGSGGFVGRILTPLVERAGHEVWGVDLEAVGERGLACDLNDRAAVEAMLSDVSPRYIVHLAAQSSGALSFDEPLETIRNNTMPVLYLLDYMRLVGSDVRLLAVGSADTYGNVTPEQLPISETTPTQPLNPYALSKVMQEACCLQYTRLYDVDVVMTRSFNHTGAGQPDRFVLPSFARQIVEIAQGGRDRTVRVGNVDVRRDFCDVNDVCDAYVSLLERGHRGEVYNICSGVSRSLREILERMAAIVGVDIDIEIDPERVRPVDMQELRGDRTKIETDTGWQPSRSFDETLRDLTAYWQTQVHTTD